MKSFKDWCVEHNLLPGYYLDHEVVYCGGFIEGVLDERAKSQEHFVELTAAKHKAIAALQQIANGTCCGCCTPGDPQCDVGIAKAALAEAKELDK